MSEPSNDLFCDKCQEFIVVCEGTWDETVVCKECGSPPTAQEIIDALHKAKAD